MPVENSEAVVSLPPVPMTVEGAAALHQMFRFNWTAWRAASEETRARAAAEAVEMLESMEQREGLSQSAFYAQVGHKGDFLFVHFRSDFEGIKKTELQMAQLELWRYLEPTSSYVSVVELGLYESTSKTYQKLAEQGLQPGTAEWDAAVADVLSGHRKAMAPRLWPEIPDRRYICFYPMDRRRGEHKNWYQVPMAERQRMMHEHGMIGRRYADVVKQIITGSIGMDDWEWGVDLFADDPVVFKKLIYEMRFDEVSAVYALFGTFYIGLRFPAVRLASVLSGEWEG